MFLENMTIRKRLASFAIIIVAIFIFMGIFSIKSLRNISQISVDIYNHPLEVSNAATRSSQQITKIQSLMKEFISSDNYFELESVVNEINEAEDLLYKNLNIIKKDILGEEGKELEKEARQVLEGWKILRSGIISYVSKDEYELAKELLNTKGDEYVESLERKFDALNKYAFDKADEFIEKASNDKDRIFTIMSVSTIVVILIVIFLVIILNKSILRSLNKLKKSMERIVSTGKIEKTEIAGKNEISEMTKDFNVLIELLKKQIWVKDGLNSLKDKLSVESSLKELSRMAIDFVAEYSNSTIGVIYLYDEEKNKLIEFNSYAFVEREDLLTEFDIGQGIIGQVALQKKAILVKNINRNQLLVRTGTTCQPPLNTYTYPLIYEGNLLGVIEVASHERFKDDQLEFLDTSGNSIASYIYSIIQRERINELLTESIEANDRLKRQSKELQETTVEVEKKQRELEVRTRELQQINQELEEHQEQLISQKKEVEAQNENLEKAQFELRKRGEELEEASKYKSEFLANMSHELRTPLNSIILISNLLKKNKQLTKDEIKKINIIFKAGNDLLDLINDILDLSKIESGNLELYKEEFTTSELKKSLQDKFDAIAEGKKLEFTIVDELKTTLYTDKSRLNYILNNFLSNAFKFTRYGKVLMTIKTNKDKHFPVEFSVKDTGIGIPMDKQKIIFDEFKQVDGSISREFGGTGLGLTISNKSANLLEGKIKLHSKEKEGSVFTLLLPENVLSKKDRDIVDKESIKDNNKVKFEDDWEVISPVDKVILVIEDDESLSKEMKNYINQLGYKMIAAFDGITGLQKAKEVKPDGIILDLKLPDISGVKVLQELKYGISTRSIPVHIFTGDNSSNKVSLQKDGAIGCTFKTPYIEDQLKDILSNITRVIEKQPKKILIVEDKEEEIEIIIDLISDWNVDVTSVSSVEDAIKKISKGCFDTAIVDLNLEDGSGFEVCQFVKEQKCNTPIIIYTAKDLTKEESKRLERYSDSIVLKTAKSHGRLIDEIAIFIHKVHNKKSYSKLSINENQPMRGKKILLCDDDMNNIFSISAVLEDLGVEIVDAFNGLEAINKLENEDDIDLILMDIMMPEMDGIEAIKRIRTNNKYNDIPIIALTAKAMKGDRETIIASGANEYISKPLDYDIFIKLLKIWLGTR
ncbi:response regulator [Clostridium sediminicola]|uniref:response regulator n=1 Tax=Clostridium sediminicola TaxID=3114879 RepID=UPI0031F270EF